MDASKLTIENVAKKFGEVIAVDRVNLSVKPGEFMALLGPSGCGKTTLLRLIAGLEKLDEGSIRLGNQVIDDMSPKDRNVAMVFQEFALYPHMTVFNNMKLPLKNRGYSKDKINEKIHWATKLMDIEDLLDRIPAQLSGGQKQRAALGRAIVREPKIFLLDEPLANLDAKLRAKMRVELKKLQRKLQVTTVFVTHDQVEAISMGDRIAVMKSGKIKQTGSSKDLYYHPSDKFVAGFIGSPSMNFFEGELLEKGEKIIIDTGDFTFPLSAEIAGIVIKKMHGSKLILGIRPENIHVNVSKKGLIVAEIEGVEPLGFETFLHLKFDNNLAVARTSAKTEFSVGKKINISFYEDAIHLFDGKTEEALGG